ncbi:MAG: cell division protein FtsQ/DivIB [Pseudomonadota bacterium]
MWPLTRKPKTPARPRVDVELTLPKAPPKSLKLLMDLRPEAQKRRPGPSKLVYRLTRSWRKVWIRRTALIILPLAMLALVAWRVATDPVVVALVEDKRAEFADMMAERPEFAVHGVSIQGASDVLEAKIEPVLALPDKPSSLNIDVAAMQERIKSLAPVRDAHVTLTANGILDIAVEERIGKALWRDEEGSLWLVDPDGIEVASVSAREARPDLPLVLGRGAPAAMNEALGIFRAAPDLHARLRALVRIGERRWNVVLDRGLTILLPETAPRAALERVMAWHFGEDLLDRGLSAVDMRLVERPTLRMTRDAAEIYLRALAADDGEET